MDKYNGWKLYFFYSELIMQQVKGLYQSKNDYMIRCQELVLHLPSKFSSYDIQFVPRNDNRHIDCMGSVASLLCLENNKYL